MAMRINFPGIDERMLHDIYRNNPNKWYQLGQGSEHCHCNNFSMEWYSQAIQTIHCLQLKGEPNYEQLQNIFKVRELVINRNPTPIIVIDDNESESSINFVGDQAKPTVECMQNGYPIDISDSPLQWSDIIPMGSNDGSDASVEELSHIPLPEVKNKTRRKLFMRGSSNHSIQHGNSDDKNSVGPISSIASNSPSKPWHPWDV